MSQEVILDFENSGRVVNLSPTFYTGIQNRILSATDLNKMAAQGNGIYGLQKQKINPFQVSPSQEPTGGVVFFDNDVTKDDFFALTRVMGIKESPKPEHANRYAAYFAESQFPKDDGFLCQLRLVDRFGLQFYFNELDNAGYNYFPAQELSQTEAYWAFIEQQKSKWGTAFDSPELNGKFGGDGNWAREQLSFGLMMENSYHSISRIWSRAWLVTK
jgi:hypothetical protein